jgi:hypothetical protein
MLLDTVGTNQNTEVSAIIDNGVDDRATCEKDRATGWIHKLTANNPELSEVRDALVGSRADMMDRVKGLNLPYIPYIHASVEDFLDNPAALAEQIRGESYFYTIQPSNYAARVESPSPGVASLDHIVEIAQYFTKKATGTEFRLVLSEVRDIAYLGNIVVDDLLATVPAYEAAAHLLPLQCTCYLPQFYEVRVATVRQLVARKRSTHFLEAGLSVSMVNCLLPCAFPSVAMPDW